MKRPPRNLTPRVRIPASWKCTTAWATLTMSLLLAVLGCRASQTTQPDDPQLSIEVDVVPLILPADTSQTATVWVTVLDGKTPASDSTRVELVATLGTVPATVYTRDGLATASFQSGREAGTAAIIAQCRGVRDTMMITLY
ncbi:MAG: hypothetical protein KAY32_13475 [Candidatus Eisenbacteria sp.]|nr:hypothetical protein [Candidatus Eisenbacteria bacterium]